MKFQQGDVLFHSVDEIPANGKKHDMVLAEGEATGHYHKVTSDNANVVEIDGTLFVDCDGEITIEHDEHKAITLPAGKWKVSQVREYDHLKEEARVVAD